MFDDILSLLCIPWKKGWEATFHIIWVSIFWLLIMTSSNETFSAILALCAGIHQSPVNSPSQRPVTRSFDVFIDLRLNTRLSKRSWDWWFETPSCSLWRHCNVTNGWLRYTSGYMKLDRYYTISVDFHNVTIYYDANGRDIVVIKSAYSSTNTWFCVGRFLWNCPRGPLLSTCVTFNLSIDEWLHPL